MRKVLTSLAVGAVVLSAAVIPSPAAAAARADGSGTFSVLSYNVAGLPEILSSASTPRESSTTAIGQRLGPYDIINVQEDFNYHRALYAADAHSHRTSTSGGAGIGSGLNTMSNYPYDADDFERVRWTSCQYDSGDCLTPKGFTLMRVRLADGVHVDVYNAHTNAGTNDGDLESRASNLSQLTAFIATHSAGNAVVVMGDTNTRYTRAGDTIGRFAAANGLTDAWVQLERGGVPPAPGSPALVCDGSAVSNSCEVVDKILYRGSRLVSLNATTYNNEHAAFVDSAGRMLSDHYPITVRFAWTRNPAFQLSEQFGGPHGDYFQDIAGVPAEARVRSIFLRSGSRVDQVGLTFTSGQTLMHGGTGGGYSSLDLGDEEYVTTSHLCRGRRNGHTRVFSISFTTNLGRTIAGGSITDDCVTRTAPAGWQIAGFHGRAGAEVDKVGYIYTER